MRGYAAVGLWHPNYPNNVGGVLRAAHCFDVSAVFIDTPRFKDDPMNVTKAHRHIPTFIGDILALRPYDCSLVVVERYKDAVSLVSFKHPHRSLYVFGPEDGSVGHELIEVAQHIVVVPSLFSLNLAATVNVVLYDRMAKDENR